MAQASETRGVLRQVAAGLAVTDYLAYRDYLKALYVRAKALSDSYSYLQIAEDLGFSRTNVVRLVIAGQRPLTSKAAEKIAKALDLHGADRRYWTTLVKYANARLPAERDNLFRLLMSYKTKSQPSELDPVQAEYFSEWYHPVIREMTALADFHGDPEWIKGKLTFPLRLEQIKRSLELLEKLGVIRRDPALGRYTRTADRIATDAEVDSIAIVRFHQKMIEIGRESITVVPEHARDIRAVTVTLPKSALPVLKGKIEEWLAQVAAMEDEDGPGEQVVQVNVQMFPFTRG
jgi:uncharacterized protein (TIGR02147 family)